MNELRIFDNPTHGRVRTLERDGQTWFVAADVCKAIHVGSATAAVSRLDDGEHRKIAVPTKGGQQDINCVNKNGVMALVIGSRKREAKEIKRWLKNEVFPDLGLSWTLDDTMQSDTVASTSELSIFNSRDFGSVRVTKDACGDLWFIASDVCRILGIQNTAQAMGRIDADDKREFDGIYTANNTLSAWCINESGLYALVFESIKPEAKAFKRWITHEVIPAIRKTGSYSVRDEKAAAQLKRADAMLLNARTRQFNAIMKVVNDNKLSPIAAEVFGVVALEGITGQKIDYRPQAEKTYSATDLAKEFGVSANAIGKAANRAGIKTDEYGVVVMDKSPYSVKEVQSFRYNERGRQRLRQLIQG